MKTFALAADAFYLPEGKTPAGYLCINDGVFAGFTQQKPACEIIDYTGCTIAPGFIDTHIHGFFGHDVMDCSAQGIEEISHELTKYGITSWVPTTLTASSDQTQDACKSVYDASRQTDGAHIQGIFLEGPFFTEKYKGAQNEAYLAEPSIDWIDAWQTSAHGLIKKVGLAPEYSCAQEFIRAMHTRHISVALGHSNASFAQAQAALNDGARVFIHTYNAMSPLHHRDPGMVGAAFASNASVFCEVIGDGHHVSPDAIGILIKQKGYTNVALISDCMCAGGMPEGAYMLGELAVEVKDGTARLQDNGALAGSILTLDQAVRNMCDWELVSPSQALCMASTVPARAFGIDQTYGSIKPGMCADCVVLDENLCVQATYVSGRCVFCA